MMYATAIALYITMRARRVGLAYFFLSLSLSMMILFHGFHHLAGYLGYTTIENGFEFGASVLALILALTYAYVWKRK